MTDVRRLLPSVNTLLETAEVESLLDIYPRSVVVDSVRRVLIQARAERGEVSQADLQSLIRGSVMAMMQPTLRSVINATGVVLHTNLGRAPLAEAALTAIAETSGGYNNLEYDLLLGGRGSRYTHCVSLLTELTGAEDAIVVNNCAAALVLALSSLSAGKEAIVSRGELVEIGGSFRIPDIMRASAARLVEVGTTNRTHVDDYVRAVNANTGVMVKVHRSNFVVEGFVAEVEIERLVPIAAERGLDVIYDLGSGLLISLEELGLRGEPLVSDAVRAGATLVLMSGDKLLGGPQAGIIVGKSAAVSRLKMNPLARAMRVDKLTIAALSATLQLYREPALAYREIPTLAMLGQDVASLDRRARSIQSRLASGGIGAEVRQSVATVGAGAFPMSELESRAVALSGNAVEVERRLRSARVPVIGHILDDTMLLDLRSVPASDDELLTDQVLGSLQ